jgi:Arc/MetJ-type ribon-helix-helix transcriptional regulator
MAKFTIQFSKKTEKDLERMIKTLGAKTKADVVRKALNLLQYVLEEQKGGGKLMVENKRENSRKEVITI